MSDSQQIKALLERWKTRLRLLRNQLEKPDVDACAIEYQLKSAEALQLSICINDLSELLIEGR